MNVSEFVSILRSNSQTFLTGAGGTGKSFTVSMLRKYLHNVIYLSSTNISAQIIGADTYHSFFKLGVCSDFEQVKGYDKQYIQWYKDTVYNNEQKAIDSLYKNMRETITNSELIIFDEVSMMSAKSLDLVYYRLGILEDVYNIPTPPVLFVGDLLQLPPVSKTGKEKMIFHSKNWNPKIIELTKIKRTESEEFMKVLKTIRAGKYTESVAKFIEQTTRNDVPEYSTRICPLNKQVDFINTEKLNTIKGELFIFEGQIDTSIKNKKQIDIIVNSFLSPRTLKLKIGAPVIFTANDKPHFYNGQRGVIKDIKDKTILVETRGSEQVVTPYQFTKNKVEKTPSGDVILVPELYFIQYPIKLSWAISCHKSQGSSIDNIIINCDGMFERSMIYVALSRATRAEGIKVLGFSPKYVRDINNESLEYLRGKKEDILYIDEVEELDTQWRLPQEAL